jgi:hypothetical protein
MKACGAKPLDMGSQAEPRNQLKAEPRKQLNTEK